MIQTQKQKKRALERLSAIVFVGLICLGKKYLEILELSEFIIEKSITQRQQKQLQDYFMNKEYAIIGYSVPKTGKLDKNHVERQYKTKEVSI